MNSVVKKLLIYTPVTALGLWAMTLQHRVLTQGFDQRGLLIGNNPDLAVLWSITGGMVLAALVLLPMLGGRGSYEQNFATCLASGGAMLAAGLIMGFSGLNMLVPETMVVAAVTIGIGLLMGLCGVMRMLGKNPTPWPDLIIGGYYAWHLLTGYGAWNANPHVQRYAFHLLAGVAVMLFTIHRARFAGGWPERRRLVFTGLMGIFLCLAAIPGAENVLFYLSSGLWCAGGMCDLKRLEQDGPDPRKSKTEH